MHPVRILVVDDETQNRRFMRRVLEPMGYRVTEAADGEEALAAISRETPDIVLLDIQMPRMDGYSVCRAIKSDPRTRLVPVVVVTSLDQIPDKVKAVELGADDYLAKPVNITELTTRVRSLVTLKHFTDELEHSSRVFEGIALVVERRDAYTHHHGKRIGDFAMEVGRALGIGETDLATLRLAGIFHDVGKIAVPDGILHKPGPLTPEELGTMKSHPTIGADLVRPMQTMERVLPLIRHHHEKLDGSGYPDGWRGQEIPLLVRILSIVDVYDALNTKRPYKEAIPRRRCLDIMREESGRGWWDRDVLETFARILQEHPEPSPAITHYC
jgi:putative two-component system response regulator